MLSDDIGTGIDQCDSSLFFGSWIIPGIGPEDFDLYVRVDALRAQGKGIDACGLLPGSGTLLHNQ